jgi:Flp pilus assembly protein TadG
MPHTTPTSRPSAPPAAREPPRRVRPGTAVTELALLLPFLALMFLAALDFARVFRVTQTLQQSAYAGALYASGASEPSGSGNPDDARNAACANGACLDPPLTPEEVTTTSDDTAGTVSVTVSYDFALLSPVLGGAAQVHLTRTVTLPRAQVPGQ